MKLNWLYFQAIMTLLYYALRDVDKYALLACQAETMSRRARNLAYESNLWMSTFMRREEDYFSRVQRLTCAVAIIYLYMIADAMWYVLACGTFWHVVRFGM